MPGSPGRFRVEALRLYDREEITNASMLAGGLNATRHAQKPLPQPAYNFCNVPKPAGNLKGSSLHEINERDHFHEAMAEMLLLCKEAMRRRRQFTGKQDMTGGAKPLSLEYLADRLDIDDPCFGYLVRSNTTKHKGMLQGFITATTFTNWQRTFRWDSSHPAAYEFDEEHIHGAGHRVRDEDGSLARELQNSVRCGDINLEGIVWPRICEISLLGGLGCGRTLINLLIEHLECMKGSAKANYDYVVLQATDNSIPFYESMGFVRVGAVMLEEDKKKSDEAASPDENSFVTSKIMSYTVRTGETLTRIANKFKADVWDVIFLNKHILGEAKPSDKPRLGTILMLPSQEEEEPLVPPSAEKIQWHVAKENETPRIIAKQYDVDYMDVVNANKGRLPGLTSTSRLIDGTRIKVSHFHIPENDYKAYAHWSFPDARFEDPEPSYMMVRKLNRRKANQRSHTPVQSALKTPIVPYEKPTLLLPASPTPVMPASAKRASAHPNAPQPPKRPLSAYMIFAAEQRELAREDIQGLPPGDTSKVFRQLWNGLSLAVKKGYEEDADHAKEQYEIEKAQYEADLQAFLATNPGQELTQSGPQMPNSAGEPAAKYSLYNKVVRLKPGAMTEASEYKYWYVLTFIPDLKWCHLAPMVQAGTFGADKPKAQGKPKWKLVDENLGKEVDISSSYCIPIKSRSMRKTLDADQEEWLIIDDGTDPTKVAPITPRALSRTNDYYKSTGRRSTAIKPSAERVRTLSSITLKSELPLLKAIFPGAKKSTFVSVVGKKTFKGFDASTIKKRGRPVGGKNRQKSPKLMDEDQGSAAVDTKAKTARRASAVKFDMPSISSSPRKLAAVRQVDKKPGSSPISAPTEFRQTRYTARPAGPSPGGILRRKSVLAALDAEKSVLATLKSQKPPSSPDRGRKRKAPEAERSPDGHGAKTARVLRSGRAPEPDYFDIQSDSSDATYNEDSDSAAESSDHSVDTDSVSEFGGDSDVDSVGAVVTRMSPRLAKRGVPVSTNNVRTTRSSAARTYLGDTEGSPIAANKHSEQKFPSLRRSSRAVSGVDNRNAERTVSPTRATHGRNTRTSSKGRKSPRRSVATKFYLNESAAAGAASDGPSPISKKQPSGNKTEKSPQIGNAKVDQTSVRRPDGAIFFCNESLPECEIVIPASFARKPSTRMIRSPKRKTVHLEKSPLIQSRPKRKAAPSFLGDTPRGKRRCVKSDGSRKL